MNAENKNIENQETEQHSEKIINQNNTQAETNKDTPSEEIEETTQNVSQKVPHILFGGQQNSRNIVDEAYEIIDGNLLIKDGGIRWVHKIIKEAPKSHGDISTWGFSEAEDKKIEIWNIEIRHWEIIRSKRGKITIHITGTIFDNDGKNSIKSGDPLEREIEWELENVKWWYSGTIQVRHTEDPDFQSAIKVSLEKWEFETIEEAEEYYSQAEIFFKTATICLWDEKYDNTEFISWVHARLPRSMRRLYNRYSSSHTPIVKKVAKLNQDHRINTKLERKRFSWKALILSAIIASTITDYKDDILSFIKGNSYEITELPQLNKNTQKSSPISTEKTEIKPSKITSNNTSDVLQNSHRWFITITSKQTLWEAIDQFMQNEWLAEGLNNKWEYLNNMPKYQTRTAPGDIYFVELQEARNGKWNIARIQKQ